MDVRYMTRVYTWYGIYRYIPSIYPPPPIKTLVYTKNCALRLVPCTSPGAAPTPGPLARAVAPPALMPAQMAPVGVHTAWGNQKLLLPLWLWCSNGHGNIGHSWLQPVCQPPGAAGARPGGGLVQARALAWYIPGTYLVH